MKKIVCYYILCCAFCSTLVAQTSPSDSLSLSLEEAVISANRSSQSRSAVAQSVRVIGRGEIEQTNAQTTADLLLNTGSVFVQKSQMGGGSPVVRGFEASRILLVVDGVRLNNAIYRAGHLQNSITLDNSGLERVELLFGPSSTIYGADALGGAICFHTKNPTFSDGGFLSTGNAFVRYGTVNEEKTAHLDFSVGGKQIAAITSVTYSDFGDLRMGKNPGIGGSFGKRSFYVERINGKDSLLRNADPYVQKFSGYSQIDLMEKVVFRQNNGVRHTLNLQFSNSSDIPRYDRLTDPSAGTGLASAEWYYGPQTRLMGAYNLQTVTAGWFNAGVSATLSVQSITESRHNRNFGASRRTDRVEKVGVLGLTVQGLRVNGKNRFTLGIDGQYNDVTSTAQRVNVNTGEITPQSTRYPDGGNTMSNAALYATHQWGRGEWLFSEGLRAGFSSLESKFTTNSREFYPFPFDKVTQNTPVASGSLSAVWNPEGHWRMAMNAASGFRVPNVDDMAKVFDSQTGSVVVPNPDLKPEKSWNLDLNVMYQINERLRWESVVWGTYLQDAIVTDVFTFNGADSIEFNGVLSRVLAGQNKRNARLSGITSGFDAALTDQLRAYASVAFTKGVILDDQSPLDHIPPTYGRAGMRWQGTHASFEGFLLFNGQKRLEDYNREGEDNLQYAPPGGTPAWLTLNTRLGYRFNKYLNIQAGVDNILDMQYRAFASGINAPGRNFWITLRTGW